MQQQDSLFINNVYTFENPLDYVGDLNIIQSLKRGEFLKKAGRIVYLTKSKRKPYIGTTKLETCIITMRGAGYATSEFKISSYRIYIWDRRLNNTRVQFWGAENGGYIFKRNKY